MTFRFLWKRGAVLTQDGTPEPGVTTHVWDPVKRFAEAGIPLPVTKEPDLDGSIGRWTPLRVAEAYRLVTIFRSEGKCSASAGIMREYREALADRMCVFACTEFRNMDPAENIEAARWF